MAIILCKYNVSFTNLNGEVTIMATFEEIKAQIGNIDDAKGILVRKEIKELPHILWEDEKVEKIVQGYYNKGTGVLVATNKRLIFVDKGLIYGCRVEDFPYDKITSIQYKTGLVLGEITIFASGNNALIQNIQKAYVKNFAEFVRARITGIKDHASFQSVNKNEEEDAFVKLEKLAQLKDKGIITEDEFNEQKKRLLNSL